MRGRESQQSVMCARERSTRGHMGLPSLAQRGEGRAGGWEWGVKPAVEGKTKRGVMQVIMAPGSGLPRT